MRQIDNFKELSNNQLWCIIGDFNYIRWPHERQGT